MTADNLQTLITELRERAEVWRPGTSNLVTRAADALAARARLEEALRRIERMSRPHPFQHTGSVIGWGTTTIGSLDHASEIARAALAVVHATTAAALPPTQETTK